MNSVIVSKEVVDLCGFPDVLSMLVYDYFVPLKIAEHTKELNTQINQFKPWFRTHFRWYHDEKTTEFIRKIFRSYLFQHTLSKENNTRVFNRTYSTFNATASVQCNNQTYSYYLLIQKQYRQDQRNKAKNRCAE